MNLIWIRGTGPSTTQELADEIELEEKLYIGNFNTPSGRRCLWGVILGISSPSDHHRMLTVENRKVLRDSQLAVWDNDGFKGGPHKRCQEMVRRMRAIP